MPYEELGSVDTVSLGGSDTKTGKANPTQIEGYLVSVEQRPNKFNPSKPQNFYIFKTKSGLKGVFAKAGIDSVLKGAQLGAMTKLISTGETKDTGKGFPMKVFKAYQDKTNTVDTGLYAAAASNDDESEDTGNEEYDSSSESDESQEEAPPARPTKPAQAAKSPTAESIARMQAALKNRVPKTV